MRSNRPTHSPFASAALDRLRRMGLAAADGFLAHLKRLNESEGCAP